MSADTCRRSGEAGPEGQNNVGRTSSPSLRMETEWPSFKSRLARCKPRNAWPPLFVLTISAESAHAAMRWLDRRLHAPRAGNRVPPNTFAEQVPSLGPCVSIWLSCSMVHALVVAKIKSDVLNTFAQSACPSCLTTCLIAQTQQNPKRQSEDRVAMHSAALATA